MPGVTGARHLLSPRTLGRLDRWRKARAVFLRPDSAEAERAVAEILGRAWTRAQVYGRARRILLDKSADRLLSDLEDGLGPLGAQLRVAPEDPAQTKWDAMGNLAPLPVAGHEVRALWLLDVIQGGEFFVEFQPIFLLNAGEIFGYEGLLRARSPDGTLHLAAEIFPASRALRIEAEFERISWVNVLEAGSRLPQESILFLNVNPRLLLAGGAGLEALGQEVERARFPYTRLAFDLVEIERVESLDRLRPALTVPRDLGVSIALDDVTSGYETLKYFQGLAPEWIKVDSEITRGIAGDPRRRAILGFLGDVARESSFRLIAEGIESAADLTVCAEVGVVAAQGYFLARPASDPPGPTAEFQKWIASRRKADEAGEIATLEGPAGGLPEPDL
jgi:EAL domain-containing protein (putative c-di-GMP-specific phosphodiesterase class I)